MPSQPIVTIAVCTWNRAGYLRDTLNGLAAQTSMPSLFEILVVDNNSTDETAEICSAFEAKHKDLQFRYVTESNQGLSFARNRAFKEAEAEVVAFIDDDVFIPPDYTEKLIEYIKKNPDVPAAGGRIFVHFDETEPNWIPKALMPMFGLHDLGPNDKPYSGNFPRGGNMVIRKQVFFRTGGFDTTLGRIGSKLVGAEEKAFFDELKQDGAQLWYWAGIELEHRIPDKRLETEYLRNQSQGIGVSERLRVESVPGGMVMKLLSEMVKVVVSIPLSIIYLIIGRFRASFFLLRFRWWVLKGFLSKSG